MPDKPGDLEEIQPDLSFFEPDKAPPPGHAALAAPARDPGRPTSTQLPVAKSHPNQRRHLRFRIEDVSAQLYAKGLLSSVGLGRANVAKAAVNLSEGGILILSSEKLRPGAKVHVHVDVESVHDALDCDGVVKWCAESARSAGKFFVGVQFAKLSDLDRSKIGAMRTWFTSREYKLKSSTRRRQL